MQLRDARTREEFVARIKAFAATVPAGTWITGGNWDHSLWGGELPTREWIDAVTPDHPVWINRLDGHMSLANSVALKLAGITRATKDIAGGAIVRDRNGEPTGVLKDNAMVPVDAVVPAPSAEMQDRALLAAMKYVNEQGVTTVHNMGTLGRPRNVCARRESERSHDDESMPSRRSTSGRSCVMQWRRRRTAAQTVAATSGCESAA